MNLLVAEESRSPPDFKRVPQNGTIIEATPEERGAPEVGVEGEVVGRPPRGEVLLPEVVVSGFAVHGEDAWKLVADAHGHGGPVVGAVRSVKKENRKQREEEERSHDRHSWFKMVEETHSIEFLP